VLPDHCRRLLGFCLYSPLDFTTASFGQTMAVCGFGYLIGSIPFGLLLTRLAGIQDIRTIGSGNIGATNVLRTGRRDLALATLLLDALKGTFAVVLATAVAGPPFALYAALGTFVGHVFPIWLGFRGGKGVATFLGCLLAINWLAALAFAAIWLGVAYLFRYSSLAALTASLATPLVLLLTEPIDSVVVFSLLAALLWLMHRRNIARLLAGTEGKIGH
jgi:glycerol-3-phosphate acyltransferase PlsY